jgi:acyl-CoA synthetase (NDP forming)
MIGSKNLALDSAFFPRSIAVVGASDQALSGGYHYLRHLLHYRFAGKIFPVNPKKASILGVQCFPSLSSIPDDVDFVICCLSTDRVLPLLKECPGKNVRALHMFTARLGETGREQAIELENEIRQTAMRLGVNIIGPNCMGIYCPESGISFGYGLPTEPGNIGVVFQSGGAATLLVQEGGLNGLRFSKAVSYGNAMQIDESDILDYLSADDKTGIIAAYFEGVADGRKFIESLSNLANRKPVIVIKGGRGTSGTRAVNTHTAAIAGSQDIWNTVFSQAGVIKANDLDEMINLLMLFQQLPPVTGGRCCIIGGGGGKCIMAADLVEDSGLSVPPFSPEIRNKLKGIVPSLWDWLGNPVDFSIWGDEAIKAVEVRQLLAESEDFDLLMAQISDDNPLDDDWWVSIIKMEVDNIVSTYKRGLKPVVAILNNMHADGPDSPNLRLKTIGDARSKLINEGVPTFNSVRDAALAVSKFVNYWKSKSH